MAGPTDKAYFNLGKWGWPVNIIALVYGVFMIINLSWPRTPTAAWYDNYIVVFSLFVVLVVGIIVYLIQRARGVDLSVTIHEIDESPAEAGGPGPPATEARLRKATRFRWPPTRPKKGGLARLRA